MLGKSRPERKRLTTHLARSLFAAIALPSIDVPPATFFIAAPASVTIQLLLLATTFVDLHRVASAIPAAVVRLTPTTTPCGE